MQTAVVARRGSLICCDPEATCCHINARDFKKSCTCSSLEVRLLWGVRAIVRHLCFVPTYRKRKSGISCKCNQSVASVVRSSLWIPARQVLNVLGSLNCSCSCGLLCQTTLQKKLWNMTVLFLKFFKHLKCHSDILKQQGTSIYFNI